MMEKAWAKVHGTYERIEAGQCSDAMRDLTGAPSYHFNMQTDSEVEAKLREFDDKDYIMAASCTADGDQTVESLEEVGLVSGHAYSLITVKQIED